MITNSKQDWTAGSIVSVGFLRLRVVRAIPTPGDYAPDAYILASIAGTKLYKFIPHNGLNAITRAEAESLIADALAVAA